MHLEKNVAIQEERNGKITQWYHDGQLGNFEPKGIKTAEGTGENGQPYKTKPEDQVKASVSEEIYAVNEFASTQINLNRTIPDSRPPECKFWHYSENLPSASIIIVFIMKA